MTSPSHPRRAERFAGTKGVRDSYHATSGHRLHRCVDAAPPAHLPADGMRLHGKLPKCVKTPNGRDGTSNSPVRTHPQRLPSRRLRPRAHPGPGLPHSTGGCRDAHTPATVVITKGGDGIPGGSTRLPSPCATWGWRGQGDTPAPPSPGRVGASVATQGSGGRLCRDTERRHTEGAAAFRLLRGPRGGGRARRSPAATAHHRSPGRGGFPERRAGGHPR